MAITWFIVEPREKVTLNARLKLTESRVYLRFTTYYPGVILPAISNNRKGLILKLIDFLRVK